MIFLSLAAFDTGLVRAGESGIIYQDLRRAPLKPGTCVGMHSSVLLSLPSC